MCGMLVATSLICVNVGAGHGLRDWCRCLRYIFVTVNTAIIATTNAAHPTPVPVEFLVWLSIAGAGPEPFSQVSLGLKICSLPERAPPEAEFALQIVVQGAGVTQAVSFFLGPLWNALICMLWVFLMLLISNTDKRNSSLALGQA